MCGIVGHVGPLTESGSDRSLTVLLDGLSRLEYRGYDSAGGALVGDEEIDTVKAAGKLEGLRTALKETPPCLATAGIGHTRWATHGGPTTANAHPHCAGRLAVVHNGIIENFRSLREEVEAAGRELLSDTDTEVVAHVLDMDYSERLALAGEGADAASILVASMRAVSARLEGTFALLAVSQDAPGAIVAARRSSPLVIGLGEGEDWAVEPATWEVSWDASAAVKGGYDTFMDKEIHDQPTAVADTLRGRFDERGEIQLDEMRIDPAVLRSVDKIIVIACGTAAYAGHVAKYAIEHWCRVLRIDESVLRAVDKIVVVACGTAAYAGHVAKYAIEHWSRIPVEVELAHEFRYRDPVVSERTLTVAISQSGETMDTIQAIRHAREQGSKVLAIVNTYGSTIARESDAVLYTHAGPEVAVASTKAFLAQITACYLLGLYRWSWPASSATGTRSWTGRRSSSRSPSPARPWTR